MELWSTYWSILRDPRLPEHRVARKTVGLAILFVIGMVYVRHWVMDLDSDKQILGTVVLSLFIIGPMAMLAGIFNATIYREVLKSLGARSNEASAPAFLAECLFTLPMPAVFLLGFFFWP